MPPVTWENNDVSERGRRGRTNETRSYVGHPGTYHTYHEIGPDTLTYCLVDDDESRGHNPTNINRYNTINFVP